MLPRGENDVNRNAIRLLAGLTILSAGCMLTPSYTRPGTPVAGHWPNGGRAAAAAVTRRRRRGRSRLARVPHRRHTA